MKSKTLLILFLSFIFFNFSFPVVSSAQSILTQRLTEGPGIPQNLVGLSSGDTLYLNIEENERQAIFSSPGYTLESCDKESNCVVNSRLDRNVNLTWLGHIQQKSMPMFFALKTNVTFLEVEYSYVDPKTNKDVKATGWMTSHHLNKEKREPIYQTVADKDQKTCPVPLAQFSRKIKKETEIEFNKKLNAIVDELLPYFGKCPYSNPRDLTKQKISAEKLVYENQLLPMLTNAKYPKKLNDGTDLSFQDFLAIDAYSRVNIGEMGRCFEKGLEYPIAEQALLLNRAEFIDKANEKNLPELATRFVREIHKDYSNDVKVATEPIQISLWNNYQNGKNLNGIGQALCPPSNPDKDFWTNYTPPSKPSKKNRQPAKIKTVNVTLDLKKKPDPNGLRKPFQDEYDIWKQSVKIAVEATLFREHFKTRVQELEDLFHYTSSGHTIKGLKPVKGLIVNGKYLTDTDCIQVWRDPKIDPVLKKLSSP